MREGRFTHLNLSHLGMSLPRIQELTLQRPPPQASAVQEKMEIASRPPAEREQEEADVPETEAREMKGVDWRKIVYNGSMLEKAQLPTRSGA